MNPAHIHLLVNHLPIVGVLIGLLVLALASGVAAAYAGSSGGEIRHSEIRKSAHVVAFPTQNSQ